MRRWLLAWPVLMAAGAPPAPPAAERPPLAPQRDASVLYRMSATGAPTFELRITTVAGGTPMRLDLPDLNYMLADRTAQRMAMVSPEQQTVLEIPWQSGLQDQFTLNDRMRFTKKGTETIASLRCTSWEVAAGPQQRGQVCITDDGVMLRTLGQDAQGRRTVMEAVSVSFAKAPSTDFVVPEGFEHVLPPSQGPQ